MGTVPNCPVSRFNQKKTIKMKTAIILFVTGLAMASATSSAKVAALKKSLPAMSYKQTMKAKSIQCDICKLMVTEIDNIIISATTNEEAIQWIQNLCGSLDGVFPGFGATCNNFVETYLPQIIEGIVNNQLSPSSVCQTLQMCSA